MARKRTILRVTAGAVLGLGLLSGPRTARAVLIIDVIPERPRADTPVALHAWRWFGDPGQKEVGTTCVRSGYHIDVEVTMRDLHVPGTAWITLMTPDGGCAALGLLRPGTYQVDAVMLMIPWYGGPPAPYDSGSACFKVAPIPGDASLDGYVGLPDLTALARNWQAGSPAAPAGWEQGNFGGAGESVWKVDLEDLVILARNWNAGSPPAPGPVPEPATLALLAAALPALLRRRKH